MTEHKAQVDELVADYNRSRAQLGSIHKALAAVSVAETSGDGLITAIVGARGTLTALTIAEDAYKQYQPTELAAQIVRLTGKATLKALARAAEIIAPGLPDGVDPQALLLGTADLSDAEIAPETAADSARETEHNPTFTEGRWSR